jgi:hypothetical protein
MKGAFELEMPGLFICINYLSYLFVYRTRRRFCDNSQGRIRSTFTDSLTELCMRIVIGLTKKNLLAIQVAKLRHVRLYAFQCVFGLLVFLCSTVQLES